MMMMMMMMMSLNAFKYWSLGTLLSLYLFSGIVFRRIACPVVHHGNFQTIAVEKEHFFFKRAHHMLLDCFDNLRVVNDMKAEQNVWVKCVLSFSLVVNETHHALACDAWRMVMRGVCTFLAAEIASGDFTKTCFKSSLRQRTKALCLLTPPATQTNASSTCLLLDTNAFPCVNSLLFHVLYEEQTMIWYP